MAAAITLKDRQCAKPLLPGCKMPGTAKRKTSSQTVTPSGCFFSPRAPAVNTHRKMRRIMQWKNKLLCAAFNEVTGGLSGIAAKFAALKEQSPELYRQSLLIGKTSNYLSSSI